MEKSGIEVAMSQSEVSESREGKRWALIFHHCGIKLLKTKIYIYIYIQKMSGIEDENIFNYLFK